jgi:Zn-dependent alcohol dehydrogenase
MTGAGAVINTANVQPGQSVAIFGVGGVGLSAVVGARVAGATPIIAVDLDDSKLEFAKQFGVTHTINATDQEPIAAIHALTEESNKFTISKSPVSGVDYAFDCIGIRQTMEQIVPACKAGQFGVTNGGTAVLVGVPSTPVELNAIEILVNEKGFIGSIGGSCAPDRDFPRFLEWQDNGDLNLDAMITKRYTLDQINEATTALAAGEIRGRAILEF